MRRSVQDCGGGIPWGGGYNDVLKIKASFFMHRHITILGSTGSIGTTALRVIDGLNSSLEEGHRYKVIALSGHSNVKLLAEQVKRYRPKYAVISDTDYFEQFRRCVDGIDVEVLTGT
jgi:1-deoxy-D-xylulose-5-phosphate reductoisomerase